MKRCILSFVLTMAMVLGMVPQFALTVQAYGIGESGSCGENATYSVSGSTLTISGSGAIADEAFMSCDFSGIEKIVIGKDITEIGEEAFFVGTFGQTSGVSVTFESGSQLTKIGRKAFQGCNKLKEITIPDSVTYIGEMAFYGCTQLETVNIPDGLTSIEQYTFENCSQLKSIEIPAGITTIGKRAFSGCDKLEEITIPENVTSIGDDAFFECTGVKDVYCYADIESISWNLRSAFGYAFGTAEGGSIIAVIHIHEGADVDYRNDTRYNSWMSYGGSFEDDLDAGIKDVSYTVTFKVVNGSWDDGTKEDKTVTLNGTTADTFYLSADDIPAVGAKPNKNYKTGKWDRKPDTSKVIYYDEDFTYRYAMDLTSVSFMEGSWENGKCVFREKSVDDPVLLDSNTTQLTDGTTYVADGYVIIEDRIMVNGNVKLILGDGSFLNAKKGIAVEEGNTLSIFGQKEGSGELKASTSKYGSPIGGSVYSEGDEYRYVKPGTVNIHGGNITATGSGCAGIGGAGSNEFIDGSSVLSGGTVNIFGGRITASSTGGGAGIGGGTSSEISGNGGIVNIYGGEVKATTVTKIGGAGIGGATGSQSGGSVTILGGMLIANGGYVGIGAYTLDGDHGTLTLGEGVSLKGSEDNSNWQVMESPYTTRYQYMIAEGPQSVELAKISHTVTFKVVNGSWDDGTTEDKTVTLNGYEGDTLKLSADDIPAAGAKPDDGYKAGSWNVTPDTTSAVTEDRTYTYTCIKKEKAVISKAPEAKALICNGQAQELVTAGETEDGTIQYALGVDDTTEPEATAYTATIPKGTDAKTYYVWYKVSGDDDHMDTEAEKIIVTIQEVTATPTAEPTTTPVAEVTATPSAEATETPSVNPTTEPTGEPTGLPSATPTAEVEATPTSTPSATPSKNPTGDATPSATPTNVVKPTATATVTPTVTPTTKSTPTLTPEQTVKKPKTPTLKSVKNKKTKKITIKWKKVKGVKGYQVQYALDKDFTESVKTKSLSKTSLTVKKLKKKKTYYVRVRSYVKDSNNKKVYSKWSKAKKVKIKK